MRVGLRVDLFGKRKIFSARLREDYARVELTLDEGVHGFVFSLIGTNQQTGLTGVRLIMRKWPTLETILPSLMSLRHKARA
jgi:hypothetical protein